jgi:hypothetical protein
MKRGCCCLRLLVRIMGRDYKRHGRLGQMTGTRLEGRAADIRREILKVCNHSAASGANPRWQPDENPNPD